MIDHVSFRVSNIEKSIEFYTKALAPLGYKRFEGDFDGAAGFGKDHAGENSGHLWVFEEGNLKTISVAHVAFAAKDTQMVQAFYEAAIAAGGVDNGAPGVRPEYGNQYYGAFVFDPDGNNIEATCFVGSDQ
ncbi:VOC family protein [Candidatus Nomurabacteria bacterium]|nr:VOC family protein [Candidatus Nomurabacteria bacterium]